MLIECLQNRSHNNSQVTKSNHDLYAYIQLKYSFPTAASYATEIYIVFFQRQNCRVIAKPNQFTTLRNASEQAFSPHISDKALSIASLSEMHSETG